MGRELTRKQMVFIIRLLVIITIAYVIVFTPSRGASQYPGFAFIAFYFFTNLVLYRVPEQYFESGRIFFFFVFFDTLLIACGIYIAGLVGTDLYLVYFLIICLASLGAQFRYLMVNVMIFTGLYGWLLYQNGYLSGEMAISYLLRLPFMIVVAMFYGFIVSAALRDRERSIYEEQERSRLLFEASDVFVFTLGLSGEYLSANPKLYKAYGFKDELSMLGMPLSDFHGPEETEIFQKSVDEVFEHGNPVQFESYDSRLGQWFSHTLSPILDRSKDRVFAVGVMSKDITERVKKEEELRQAYEKLRETRDQLIQKDKMAALGRLASGIAHEIRNPLEIISMGVDYLENIMPDQNTSANESIEKIYSAIDRANAIIDDVLKFSRKTEFLIEPVDICGLTDEVLSLAAHRIRKTGVRVFKQYQDNLLKVAGNRNMISQVLLNIVDNAVGSMEKAETKELHISVYTKIITEVGYKTGYRRADYFKMNEEMVVVEITDTGGGIAEDVLLKIFEPFFTTKAAGEGTGLGLSIAHMIMDRMMGTIDVDSKVGCGTTFYVKMQPESKMEMIKEVEYDREQEKGSGY